MDALQKNLVALCGEVMGASLLAAAAIHTSMMLIQNREELLNGISAWIDDTLNRSRSATAIRMTSTGRLWQTPSRFSVRKCIRP